MLRSMNASSVRRLYVQRSLSTGTASRSFSQRASLHRSTTVPSLLPIIPRSATLLVGSRSFSWTPWRTQTPPPPNELPSIPAALEQPAKAGPVASSEPIASSSAPNPSLASTAPTPLPSAPHADPTLSAADQLLPQPPADVLTPTIRELLEHHSGNAQAVLDSPEAVHAAMQIGDLHLMGLTHSFLNPAGWIRDVLELVHVNTGLPWYGSIMAVTLMLRLCVFPMVVRVQGNNTRLAAIQPQSQAVMAKIKEAKLAGDLQSQRVYAQEISTLWKENDCSPFKSLLLPLVQMPLFMSFFFAIRKMALLPVPQLKEGGLSWVLDLTATDPYYILPVSSMALTLYVLKIGADGTGGVKTRTMQHALNGFLVISPVMVYFIGQMPAALLFYWTFNNALTLLQAVLLKQTFFRNLLGLEPPPAQVALPEGTKYETDPTIRDSWNELKTFLRERAKNAQEEQERRAAERLKAGPGRQGRLAGPTMQHGDVIRERAQPLAITPKPEVVSVTEEAYKAGTASGFLESKPDRSAKRPAVPPSAPKVKDEKAQRVAAARERRERNARR